jgi:hypothetical protein
MLRRTRAASHVCPPAAAQQRFFSSYAIWLIGDDVYGWYFLSCLW